MQIVVRSRNVELSEALRAAAIDKVGRLHRFLEGMDHAEVMFSGEKNPRITQHDSCEVTLAGHGHHVRAKAASPDAFASLDLVVDKLEHQLTKLKGKLVGRTHRGPATREIAAGGVVAEPVVGSVEATDPDENVARIVKTKAFAMTVCVPDDAVLQMDLLQHDFYVFINAETDRPGVVYRRDDGHIGLIDVTHG